MPPSKAEIRQQMLTRRRALPPDEAAERSAAVCARVEALPAFSRAPLVLAYVASKDNEADTRPLLERLLAEGRAAAVPWVAGRGTMGWSHIARLEDLAPGRFGILEPVPGRRIPVTPEADSVCLVPGLAFTRDGARIGYGGGYFDRFLADYPGLSIGLAYDFQVTGGLPREPWDQPVNMVAAESGVWSSGAD